METTRIRSVIRPDWYLDPRYIRQPQNTHWSAADRELIHEMRVVREVPIDQIMQAMAQRLGVSLASNLVTRTKIHNQIRISRAVVKGLCHRCRRKLHPEDLMANENRGDQKLCVHCIQSDSLYKSTRRNKAIKRGLCGVCQRRKVLRGRTECKICLSYVQRIRILKGLCGSCGKHPINKSRSKALCNRCLTESNKRGREYRTEKK